MIVTAVGEETNLDKFGRIQFLVDKLLSLLTLMVVMMMTRLLQMEFSILDNQPRDRLIRLNQNELK